VIPNHQNFGDFKFNSSIMQLKTQIYILKASLSFSLAFSLFFSVMLASYNKWPHSGIDSSEDSKTRKYELLGIYADKKSGSGSDSSSSIDTADGPEENEWEICSDSGNYDASSVEKASGEAKG
jgi:hypothetical protein